MREVNNKPEESRDALRQFIRQSFKEKAHQQTRDIPRIEYWLNLGERQLKSLKSSEASGFTFIKPKGNDHVYWRFHCQNPHGNYNWK
jgi:hypothetical protein